MWREMEEVGREAVGMEGVFEVRAREVRYGRGYSVGRRFS